METLVIALGGNALLQRGESLSAANQYQNIQQVATLIASLTSHYRITLVHGNGPQVGLLALQNQAYPDVPPYPLDILVAETQGMIGYMLMQCLAQQPNMPPITTLLTRVLVDANDPAFQSPTKYIGPVYSPQDQAELETRFHWQFKQDGQYLRRVVPSPKPQHIVEIDTISSLLSQGNLVISNGGGGIPMIQTAQGYQGVEAVIDKDLSAAQLATELKADHFMILTDTDAVYLDWGTPDQRALRQVTTAELTPLLAGLDAGSMRPKVQATVDFVNTTGNKAYIGKLTDVHALLQQEKGTCICAKK